MKYRAVMTLTIVTLALSACGKTNSPAQNSGTGPSTESPAAVAFDQSILGVAGVGTQGTANDTEVQGLKFAESDAQVSRFASREVILELGQADRKSKLEKFLAKYGGEVLDNGDLPAPPPGVKAVEGARTNSGLALVRLTPPKADPAKLLEKLERKGLKGKLTFSEPEAADLFALTLDGGDVEGITVSPNWLSRPTYDVIHEEHLATGTSYLLQATSRQNDALVSMDVSNPGGAWEHYANGAFGVSGFGVSIAIIDSGFLPDNYDLSGYNPETGVYLRPGASGYDFTENNYDVTSSCCPNNDHGTHVAALAAGTANNRYGTSGVAYDANLLLFRASRSNTSTGEGDISDYNAARAVNTAVAWGAKVINMSFARWTRGATEESGSGFRSALAYAQGQGLVSVAGAGNNGRYFDNNITNNVFGCCDYPVPATWPEVIAVGAHNQVNGRSVWTGSSSNYGPGVDIYAPGGDYRYGDIVTTPTPNEANLLGIQCYSSDPALQYCRSYPNQILVRNDPDYGDPKAYRFRGTSAASALAAGMVALMKQVNSSLTRAQVQSYLQSYGRTGTDNNRMIYAGNTLRALGAYR